MVSSGAFNYVNVWEWLYMAKINSVIANNIANVDTPGFKRQDVKFEEYLLNEVGYTDDLDSEVARADLDNLSAMTYTDYGNVSYRLDGNNVDIDTENAELAKNQIKYYTMLDSTSQEFSRLKTVTRSSS